MRPPGATLAGLTARIAVGRVTAKGADAARRVKVSLANSRSSYWPAGAELGMVNGQMPSARPTLGAGEQETYSQVPCFVSAAPTRYNPTQSVAVGAPMWDQLASTVPPA